MIIGDAVGNDKLCDRFANYGKSVTRLCRDCDCPSDKLNDFEHKCVLKIISKTPKYDQRV